MLLERVYKHIDTVFSLQNVISLTKRPATMFDSASLEYV